MKRKIISIWFVVSCLTLSAQENNTFDYLNNKLDSLILLCSNDEFIYNTDWQKIREKFRTQLPELTVEYQNLMIDKVENLFEQKEYSGLYGLAYLFLEDFYYYRINADVKKRIIEIWYDKICYHTFFIECFGNSQYYSDKAKQRLADIIERKWI
jgi:hypothetical protein